MKFGGFYEKGVLPQSFSNLLSVTKIRKVPNAGIVTHFRWGHLRDKGLLVCELTTSFHLVCNKTIEEGELRLGGCGLIPEPRLPSGTEV